MKANLVFRRVAPSVVAAAVVAAALAGCSSGDTSPRPTTTSTSTVTATATATATVPSTAAPTAAAGSGANAGSGDAAAAGEPARCQASALSGAIGERDGNAAGSGSGMNQQQVAIILTNTGTSTCTLQGWPGVSFVGQGDGTQIGAPATLDRSTPHATVTLPAGQKAQAPIDIVNAGVFSPGDCQQTTANGLRVYPPGSKQSLFIAQTTDACSSTSDPQLSVGAFVTYP